MAQHKADNSRNTRDVQNIQRREQLLAEVQLARQRMPWMQYDARFEAYEKDIQVRTWPVCVVCVSDHVKRSAAFAGQGSRGAAAESAP